MFVNNEVGTVEPMYDIEDIVSEVKRIISCRCGSSNRTLRC